MKVYGVYGIEKVFEKVANWNPWASIIEEKQIGLKEDLCDILVSTVCGRRNASKTYSSLTKSVIFTYDFKFFFIGINEAVLKQIGSARLNRKRRKDQQKNIRDNT